MEQNTLTYPTVVVEVVGGVVNAIIGDRSINVIVLDYDTDSYNEDAPVIQGEHAYVRDEMCCVDKCYVDRVMGDMP